MTGLDHYERCAAVNGDLPNLHDDLHAEQMRTRQADMLERVRTDTWHDLGWADETTTAFLDAVQGADFFLDVGAEAGFYTALALRHMGAESRVISIEPDPVYAAQLAEAFLDDPRVRVIQAAAAATPGTVTLTKPRGCSATAAAVGGIPFQAQAVTIDGICLGACPDLIKIDVEGAEAGVLTGAARILQSGHSTVFLEYHPWAEDIQPGSRETIRRAFHDAGMSVYRADDTGTLRECDRIGGRMIAARSS